MFEISVDISDYKRQWTQHYRVLHAPQTRDYFLLLNEKRSLSNGICQLQAKKEVEFTFPVFFIWEEWRV